jgi:hypothetical protein
MVHPLKILVDGAMAPSELEQLIVLFDEIWASLMIDNAGTAEESAKQRMRLATLVLELSRDGRLDALQITATASKLMRSSDSGRSVC